MKQVEKKDSLKKVGSFLIVVSGYDTEKSLNYCAEWTGELTQ